MSYKDDDIRTIETIGLHNLLSFGPDTESISLKAYDMFHNAVISAEDGELSDTSCRQRRSDYLRPLGSS